MTKSIDQEEFLIQHLTEGKSYKEIVEKNNIPITDLRIWWETGNELRNQIKRSNILFASKKSNPEFADFLKVGQRGFFNWFRNQPRNCAYCGIEEIKLQQLFDKDRNFLSTKRGRGRTLELDRVDAKSNKYKMDNCVFACYFCNNHKSDILSADDHKKYFAESIRKYLDDKYTEMLSRDN